MSHRPRTAAWIAGLLLALAPPARAQRHWAPAETGTRAELRGLHAVSARVVWASGRGGVVVRTVDSGRTWRTDTIPGAANLFLVDVHALDDRVAWVVGTAFEGPAVGRIFHTADGGASWTLQHADSTPGIFLDGLTFLDAHQGIAFGDPIGGRFLILRTGDGGASWRPLRADRAPPALPGEAAFAASGTSITARDGRIWIGTGGGARARVLSSEDGGSTWTAVDTPASGGESKGIFGLAFGPGGLGVAVGGDYRVREASSGNLLLTGDGGRSWLAATSGGLAGIQYGVAHAGDEAFVAVGPPSTAVSEDGGRTWSRVEGPGFNTVTCAGRLAACWAAGTDGRVARLVP